MTNASRVPFVFALAVHPALNVGAYVRNILAKLCQSAVMLLLLLLLLGARARVCVCTICHRYFRSLLTFPSPPTPGRHFARLRACAH